MSLKQIDETSLERFLGYMRTKMEQNIDKPIHWSETNIETLLLKLKEEVTELESLLKTNGKGIEVLAECADIANFAMFLGFRYKFQEVQDGINKEV